MLKVKRVVYVSTDCSLQELMCCPSVGPSNTACCRLRLPLLQSPVFAAAPSKCICREISRLDLCRRPPGRAGRAGPSSAGRGVTAPQYSQCCEYPSTSSSLGPHCTPWPVVQVPARARCGCPHCPPTQCPVSPHHNLSLVHTVPGHTATEGPQLISKCREYTTHEVYLYR